MLRAPLGAPWGFAPDPRDFEGIAGQLNRRGESRPRRHSSAGGVGDSLARIRLSLVGLRPRRARLRFAGRVDSIGAENPMEFSRSLACGNSCGRFIPILS